MKKEKLKKMLPLFAVLLLMIFLLGYFLQNQRDNKGKNISSAVRSDAVNTEKEENGTEDDAALSDENTEEGSADDEKKTTLSGNAETVGNRIYYSEDLFLQEDEEPQESDGSKQESDKTDHTNKTEAAGKTDEGYIKFPYEAARSSLMIQRVQAYDGSYVEDGSNDQVSDVAAILVTNTGDQCVEYADITLISEEGTLKFSLTALGSGASCIIAEADKTAYKTQDYTECTVESAFLDEMEMSETLVEVKEIKSGALTVKNISNDKIPGIRVFYKYYDEENQVYIGGAAYNAQVTDLEPGYSKLVTPDHYVSGQSKVIMVRTYESNE